jgi:hypothetical protein
VNYLNGNYAKLNWTLPKLLAREQFDAFSDQLASPLA